MASSKKLEEAQAYIRDAEKSLKTGLLKWHPDHDSAADEYNKAAVCFKTARHFPQAVDSYLKASSCFQTCGSNFAGAKALENASIIAKELGDLDKVADLAERACKLYRENGTVDTAALVLDKAAKLIEGVKPQRAMDLYKQAVDIVLCEGQPRRAAEYQTKLCRLLVRMQRYQEASEALKTNMSYLKEGDYTVPIGRECVALVLVQLAKGDHIAGERAFRDWGGYCQPEEVGTLTALLDAYDEQDGDMARKMLRTPFIRHMDVEYSKLARDLQTPPSKKEHEAKEALAAAGGTEGGGAEEDLDLC